MTPPSIAALEANIRCPLSKCLYGDRASREQKRYFTQKSMGVSVSWIGGTHSAVKGLIPCNKTSESTGCEVLGVVAISPAWPCRGCFLNAEKHIIRKRQSKSWINVRLQDHNRLKLPRG